MPGEKLLAGAQRAGFSSDWWTCQRVAILIERRFGVHYHPDHVEVFPEAGLDLSEAGAASP